MIQDGDLWPQHDFISTTIYLSEKLWVHQCCLMVRRRRRTRKKSLHLCYFSKCTQETSAQSINSGEIWTQFECWECWRLQNKHFWIKVKKRRDPVRDCSTIQTGDKLSRHNVSVKHCCWRTSAVITSWYKLIVLTFVALQLCRGALSVLIFFVLYWLVRWS